MDRQPNSRLRNLSLFPGLLLWLLLSAHGLFPCTVAVISGKATPDRRPLLWKNRDASDIDNKLVYIKGPKFAFIGLVNARDKENQNVWAGINSQGFAIINALASDLAEDEKAAAENGRLMRLALGECSGVAEFEAMLVKTNGQRQVAANFGVIDAYGQACFFETSKTKFVKFDANDPRVAPFGYIIRTNFAFTAAEKFRGGGYIRFERASHLFEKALAENRLDLRFILQEAARDLVNEKLHSYPLTTGLPDDPAKPLYINTNDTINRNSTVAVTVFHGAKEPQKAHLATMWTILGQPIASVAVPVWVMAPEIPAPLNQGPTAPLNDAVKALVRYLYPDSRGHMPQYLNVTRLRTYGNEGVLAKLLRIENEVLTRTMEKMTAWENVMPSVEEVANYEKSLAAFVLEALKAAFPDL